jgi:hypothetical protein
MEESVLWWVRILYLEARIWIRVKGRIRIKVKSRIRIRNTGTLYVVFHYGGDHLCKVLATSLCFAQSIPCDPAIFTHLQCFGSRFNQVIRSGSGSRKAKMTHHNTVESAGCSVLRAEVFSCRLDVFYEGLGISTLPIFEKK